ncbi:hypothetical protein LL266_02455 [Vibrio anguillarum]|jgi:hypothetical protein|uniref:Uncharacterized protein n=2 Tax=Vibrio TaxID=662 RepID=A0A1V9JZD9_VIBAN|nr:MULTISPECIES: hypothetical protein [Vibrio]NCO47403.1 hypothetical protein [Vibrio sp.]AEH33131.1 hypothetical protein VAA_01444 [Vibrio anguillarum 775]AGU57637.1 hypothetical protein N175_07905 [Vibrio anguillarum M3]ASF91913.1 hypothetical protein CEA93_07640 [Vibrio anguillarum]ASG07432.1 hypothetical protein CEQ50_07595 [Vibrio anguillarum]
MNIHFNIKHCSWNATIHQLNSDILTRHILSQINCNLDTLHLNFIYDEESSQGQILNADDKLIGHFNIID